MSALQRLKKENEHLKSQLEDVTATQKVTFHCLTKANEKIVDLFGLLLCDEESINSYKVYFQLKYPGELEAVASFVKHHIDQNK